MTRNMDRIESENSMTRDEENKISPCIIGYQKKKFNESNVCNVKKSLLQRMTINKSIIYNYCLLAVVHILAVIYFARATYIWSIKSNPGYDWCNGYGLLLLVYAFIYIRLFHIHVFKKFCLNKIKKISMARLQSFGLKYKSQKGEIIFCVTISVAIICFLIIDARHSKDRLMGFIGIFVMMLIGWIFSKHPTKIDWKPIVWGLLFQFTLGLISMRLTFGRQVFQCITDKVVVFLNFAFDGAKLVYSEKLVDNGIFAFTVFPVIIFFSATVSILYHYGLMQYIIMKIGWFLSVTLGTTACESLHAATTLFLGMPESFLVIESYLNKLTTSEMHAVMCSVFSTISGTVLTVYMSYGAKPEHILTAMMMSAPAGLSYAKLLYPETEKSSTQLKNIVLKKPRETSLIEAIYEGSLSAIPLILGCAANLIAFVSVIEFLNDNLAWLGSLVGYQNLSFEFIFGKIFKPVSFIIGVPWEECENVSYLIGLKIVVNELVAYKKFGEIKKTIGFSPKAEAIVTHAICGFTNPSTLGIIVGSLSTMASEKKKVISEIVIRAFLGGIIVCFITASIAGMLVIEDA